MSEHYIKTGEYGGIDIDEYKGKYSLVSGREKDGVFYKDWAFPQDKDRRPRDKAVPVKVDLGDGRDQAIKTLRHFLSALGALPPGPEEITGPEAPQGDGFDDIPF